MLRKIVPFMAAATFAISAPAFSAEPMNLKNLYAGGGFSHNRVDLDNFGGDVETASGWQFFGGVKAGERNGFDLAVEVGYMQTGDFISGTDSDAKGVWAAGVTKKQLNEIDPRLSAVARLGVDLGDDDGLIMGFGAELKVHPKVFIRGEYLNKDLTQSYQLNAGYEF